MVGSWQTVTLEEVSDDITVGHVGLMTDQYVASGVPFLRSLNIEKLTIKTDDLKYIGPEFHSRLKKSALKPGDVVIVRTGKPGACAVVPDWLADANCSDLVIVRPGSKVSPSFLAYVVNSVAQRHIDAHIVGAVQQHFNVGSARTLRFMLPPIAEQDRIVELIGAIQTKIELSRRIAETLEAIARALFQSWFVDFDPVRAKIEGRDADLPDDLAALFPDNFGDDGRPDGWQSRPLPTLARFLNGLALQKYPAQDDEPSLPVIKIAELRIGPTPKSGRASKSVPADYHVRDGDHLFSWSGSLTHCLWTHGPGALNQHLFKVSALSGVPDWLVYQAVEYHMPEFQAIASGKAVTMGHIQRHHLDQAAVACPPSVLLRAMDSIMSPLQNRSLAAALQSRTLSALRDTLLPKLMSGELRIADAEKRIAAA